MSEPLLKVLVYGYINFYTRKNTYAFVVANRDRLPEASFWVPVGNNPRKTVPNYGRKRKKISFKIWTYSV